MKLIKNILNNNKGFTLAEGMVTAGLLGVVSLAMLQGIKEDSKTKAYARINDDIQTIMNSINNSMKDTDACSASLTGVAPVPKSSSTQNTVASIRDNSGSSILRSTLPGFGAATIQSGQAVGPGLAIAGIRVVNFANFFNVNTDLADNTSDTFSTYRYGSVELEVQFRRTTGTDRETSSFDNAKSITERTILVHVRVQGTTISSCANMADLTSLQLKQQICGTRVVDYAGNQVIVGSFNPTDGTCAGIKESLNAIGSQKICTELGGVLDAAGDCVPFGSQGGVVCPNGFKGIVNGVPGCF